MFRWIVAFLLGKEYACKKCGHTFSQISRAKTGYSDYVCFCSFCGIYALVDWHSSYNKYVREILTKEDLSKYVLQR